MAIIGELGVNIVANTKKFVTGIANVKKQVKTLTTGFAKATKGLQNFSAGFLGIGGGLSLAGLTASLANSAREIDKLAKTSQKLGIATEELVALQVAADRTGVEISALETGLQRMTRRVAEAATGTGTAVDALNELNLNAAELAQLTPDETFRRIADAMGNVTNQNDKIRLAFKLFDTEGVNLLRTLEGGSTALDQFRLEAQRLGLAISAEEAKKVENFNDALSALKQQFGAFSNRILIELAPGLTETLQGLTLGFQALEQRRKQAGKPRGQTATVSQAGGLARLNPAFRGVEFLQRQVFQRSLDFFASGIPEGQAITAAEKAEGARRARAIIEELKKQTALLRDGNEPAPVVSLP